MFRIPEPIIDAEKMRQDAFDRAVQHEVSASRFNFHKREASREEALRMIDAQLEWQREILLAALDITHPEHEMCPEPTEEEIFESYLHDCKRLGEEPDLSAFLQPSERS